MTKYKGMITLYLISNNESLYNTSIPSSHNRINNLLMSYHLHHLYFCIEAQLIHECLEILLHLNAVVIQVCHGKDAHLTFFPHLKKAAV